jgi:hypothetical protein
VERLLSMLSELKVPVIGVIENMARPGNGSRSQELAERYRTSLLGSIAFEEEIDGILAGAAGGAGLPDGLAASIGEITGRIEASRT